MEGVFLHRCFAGLALESKGASKWKTFKLFSRSLILGDASVVFDGGRAAGDGGWQAEAPLWSPVLLGEQAVTSCTAPQPETWSACSAAQDSECVDPWGCSVCLRVTLGNASSF